MNFISDIYRLTESFPDREKYGLTSQIRRAAVSIALNIAEGSACDGDKEFARYLSIAFNSNYEVICGLEIAHRLGMCSKFAANRMIDQSDEIAAMITGFIQQLRHPGLIDGCQLQTASSK